NKKPVAAKDSQDELLEVAADMMVDDLMAEVELAEQQQQKQNQQKNKKAKTQSTQSQLPPPTSQTAPVGRKRKSALIQYDEDEDDAMESDATEKDDDDADDDYKPDHSVPGAVTGRRGTAGRGRAIVDDSDDDDDMMDAAATSSESEAAASPAAKLPRTKSHLMQPIKTPDLKRMRFGGSMASTSSEGMPLMGALNSVPNPPDTPSLARTTTSLSALSVGSSRLATPLAQRAQLQAPPLTADESKRLRVSNFAKKNDERYAWLEDVRDAQGVRPGEVGYDKRTLLIPASSWKQFSPFERQYWEIKSQHWDTVVFFKKGKFYELYENDATIGHQEFDLKMTDRVNMRMAGVPESSFDHWVSQFLAKGYKIARVDQMESKLAKDMRERGSSKKGDSLVSRELTGVLTVGTLVDPSLLTQDLSTFCLALVEATHEVANSGEASAYVTSFGIAFVDTSTAQFHMCTIADDDDDRSALETLLVQLNPREVIYVRGGAGPGHRAAAALSAAALTKGASNTGSGLGDLLLTSPDAWDGMAGISQPTWRTLKNTCGPNTDWIAMAPRREFWDVPTTKHEIDQAGYFASSEEPKKWPEALQRAADKDPLALTAVGGLLSYLRTLMLDKDLASLGNFSFYSPMQNSTALVLDGPTISNLDIFSISSDNGNTAAIGGASRPTSIDGTLFALLNHVRTPFGRRLLSRWTCHPLRHSAAINARLNVVDFFLSNGELSDSIVDVLAGLTDLERGLSRIHSGRCKVPDFIAVLSGLASVSLMMERLRKEHGCDNSALPARIKTLLRVFPPLDELLAEFTSSFDANVASAEGRLLPFPGGDQPCDEIMAKIGEHDEWLAQHLKEIRKRFGCASIVYKNMGKEHYQLEMPTTVKVPDNFFRLSATKAVNRYWSPELRTKVQERAEAMETKSMVLDSYQSRLYARFDRHYALLMKAVSVVAELDCLLALSTASSCLGTPACRPIILESNGNAGGYIEFRQLRHPCVALSSAGASDFVANDIVLGRKHDAGTKANDGDSASMILLTGPNMGGKSTLLRQLCLGVILAQLGCYVPAQSAAILPVDRLFTRIGARDNMLAGRSTFMVEMAETSTILRYASPRSLVVLDELGRGTSTHDGEAVAYGVLHSLCSRLGCLGFFSTHYGLLADSLLKPAANGGSGSTVEPHLRPMFMACAVNEEEHRVTFLYRLQRGIASKSHGMNVAAMAGVPVSIVRNANAIAEKFERELKQRQALKSGSSVDDGEAAVPLTMQSDFANLLRMAALQSKSKNTSLGDNDDGEQVPVGGPNCAKKANENQYWSCIVDHLRRTMRANALHN
ncbi:DNA mismatch repair protein msh6, partial [Kickxella alabastrina]